MSLSSGHSSLRRAHEVGPAGRARSVRALALPFLSLLLLALFATLATAGSLSAAPSAEPQLAPRPSRGELPALSHQTDALKEGGGEVADAEDEELSHDDEAACGGLVTPATASRGFRPSCSEVVATPLAQIFGHPGRAPPRRLTSPPRRLRRPRPPQ